MTKDLVNIPGKEVTITVDYSPGGSTGIATECFRLWKGRS
jgi:hypothetical protein